MCLTKLWQVPAVPVPRVRNTISIIYLLFHYSRIRNKSFQIQGKSSGSNRIRIPNTGYISKFFKNA